MLIVLMSIVLLAFSVGLAIGFGSSLLAMTLGIHFFPMDFLLPVVVILNIVASLYVTVRHRTGIDAPLLYKKILPFTLLGLPVGFVLFNVLRNEGLKFGFGAFVVLLAVSELVRTVRADGRTPTRPLGPFWSRVWLFAGGVVQGLWVSGGPLVAYWAGRNIAGKRQFRSTLFVLWLVLNFILFIGHLATGRLTMESVKTSVWLLPAVLGGMVIGEWLHNALPEKTFRIVVYTILIFAGLSILVRGW